MKIEDILQAETDLLDKAFAHHDTSEFTRALADYVGEWFDRVGVAATPRHVYARPAAERGPAPSRPRRATAGLSSRALPAPPEPSAREVSGHLMQLCVSVLQSDEIDTLADFATEYDDAGARTFGCLLYSLNRKAAALFWWRFAAGAGDELAAHCLAVHHAAVGRSTDARIWRWTARAMGFAPERHIPSPTRAPVGPAPGIAHNVGPGTPLQPFLQSDDSLLEFLGERPMADR